MTIDHEDNHTIEVDLHVGEWLHFSTKSRVSAWTWNWLQPHCQWSTQPVGVRNMSKIVLYLCICKVPIVGW